jgi:2-polyprenyl-3-methyl-5-hydroxy-6-metoxy-1,4-benzoquinol methylase
VRHDELARTHTAADPSLKEHLFGSAFSIRLLRYWWAGQAIAEESRRQGRALRVLDVGCERGWLKFFTPSEAVARWVGLDWDLRQECIDNARYDEVIRANFDEPLSFATGSMDVVVSNHVMEHLPRPGSTMAEMSTCSGLACCSICLLPSSTCHRQ